MLNRSAIACGRSRTSSVRDESGAEPGPIFRTRSKFWLMTATRSSFDPCAHSFVAPARPAAPAAAARNSRRLIALPVRLLPEMLVEEPGDFLVGVFAFRRIAIVSGV